jgi:hypothetical protein
MKPMFGSYVFLLSNRARSETGIRKPTEDGITTNCATRPNVRTPRTIPELQPALASAPRWAAVVIDWQNACNPHASGKFMEKFEMIIDFLNQHRWPQRDMPRIYTAAHIMSTEISKPLRPKSGAESFLSAENNRSIPPLICSPALRTRHDVEVEISRSRKTPWRSHGLAFKPSAAR